MWIQISEYQHSWGLTLHPLVSIPRLSPVVILAERVLDMLAVLRKQVDSDISSLSSYTEDTFELQQKLVQELLVLQQEQDLALAIKLGEV